MKYRIPPETDLPRAFGELKRMAKQEGYEFSGNTTKGSIKASGQIVKYSVSKNTINITFPSPFIEMMAEDDVRALLDKVFN